MLEIDSKFEQLEAITTRIEVKKPYEGLGSDYLMALQLAAQPALVEEMTRLLTEVLGEDIKFFAIEKSTIEELQGQPSPKLTIRLSLRNPEKPHDEYLNRDFEKTFSQKHEMEISNKMTRAGINYVRKHGGVFLDFKRHSSTDQNPENSLYDIVLQKIGSEEILKKRTEALLRTMKIYIERPEIIMPKTGTTTIIVKIPHRNEIPTNATTTPGITLQRGDTHTKMLIQAQALTPTPNEKEVICKGITNTDSEDITTHTHLDEVSYGTPKDLTLVQQRQQMLNDLAKAGLLASSLKP